MAKTDIELAKEFSEYRAKSHEIRKAYLESRGEPTAWVCDECGQVDESADVIIDHLVNKHDYPEEDAETSCLPIYVHDGSQNILKDLHNLRMLQEVNL